MPQCHPSVLSSLPTWVSHSLGAHPATAGRFEADVSAMQRDSSTYCDEPEDEEDYAAWLDTFDLAARRPDIDALIASNTFMAELQVGSRELGLW